MKKVEVKELQNQVLLKEREALLVENEGKLLGYYYPVNDIQEVNIAFEEMEKIVEKVMQETGWTEDELVENLTKKSN